MLAQIKPKEVHVLFWMPMFALETMRLWQEYWFGAKPVCVCQILQFKKKAA